MRSLASLSRRPHSRMFETPEVELSTAPTEIDGQEVFVHKRANLFPRSKGKTT